MSVLRGDCVEVMAGMDADSIDAIVCDPPYGLEFMGKEWDRLLHRSDDGWSNHGTLLRPRYEAGRPAMEWHAQWATAALRVAKPGAYLLAFGGTRTVHRMTCALEDAGWVIRDMLQWVYLSGFPKSRASLKPAYEPIVLARKPGASRDLDIDGCRIGENAGWSYPNGPGGGHFVGGKGTRTEPREAQAGRWPSNVLMTEDVFGGGVDGVVGGGETGAGAFPRKTAESMFGIGGYEDPLGERATDSGSKSRIFIIPKAPRTERVLSDGRRSPHPTQKPEALIRHLVKLVTPDGGVVLDPFLGSGTLGVVCEGLGVQWIGIEREPEYADWAEDRIRDGQPEWEAA